MERALSQGHVYTQHEGGAPIARAEAGGLLEERQPDQSDAGCDAQWRHPAQQEAHDTREAENHLESRRRDDGPGDLRQRKQLTGTGY